MLHADHLSVAYGNRQVLSAISLDLLPGQVLGIIGPNGSGKSTLVRALSGVIPLKYGTISVGGKDLTHSPASQRARWIAVVPQALQMPPAFTAWETVLLGRTPHLNWFGQVSPRDEEIVRKAMTRTRTLELADRPVGELSGGEQQRVLLARAIAQTTPVLMLDEPTSHLDLQYQVSLLDQVSTLAHDENLAVLLVVHDLNLVARYADRVAMLVEGRLIASGKPGEVLTPGLLSRVYQVPLQVLPTGRADQAVILPAG